MNDDTRQKQEDTPPPSAKADAEPISMAEFLEGVPPSEWRKVHHLVYLSRNSLPNAPTPSSSLMTPELQLYCSHDRCNGLRVFRRADKEPPGGVTDRYPTDLFVAYVCSNCQRNQKTFAVRVILDKAGLSGSIYKYGEDPVYGPPTPARLISLIGPARETFLKGRRCENQGLGIGAFAYYRRIIEEQKSRLIEKIIQVAQRISAPEDMIAALEHARNETQFSRAIEQIRDAIPESLRIHGHNPLSLLHSALSEGLHASSDEECLELAHTIRLVLAELSERISQSLKDHQELNEALSRLMNRMPKDS